MNMMENTMAAAKFMNLEIVKPFNLIMAYVFVDNTMTMAFRIALSINCSMFLIYIFMVLIVVTPVQTIQVPKAQDSITIIPIIA